MPADDVTQTPPENEHATIAKPAATTANHNNIAETNSIFRLRRKLRPFGGGRRVELGLRRLDG